MYTLLLYVLYVLTNFEIEFIVGLSLNDGNVCSIVTSNILVIFSFVMVIDFTVKYDELRRCQH